jgi:hypothetical protein
LVLGKSRHWPASVSNDEESSRFHARGSRWKP